MISASGRKARGVVLPWAALGFKSSAVAQTPPSPGGVDDTVGKMADEAGRLGNQIQDILVSFTGADVGVGDGVGGGVGDGGGGGVGGGGGSCGGGGGCGGG